MAGLPRAGSTLLSSISNQNPRFYSGPSSPVTGIMLTIENYVPTDELYQAYPKPQQVGQLIANVINHYYSDVDKPIIFDKNRSWVNRMHYIPGYFGSEPKVLCPVRNIDEILASFIDMHNRNPFEVDGRVNFIDEMLIKNNIPLTDENRCKFLVSPRGILGQSYNGIKKALMEGRQNQIHFIEYDDLMTNPEETMRKVYDFLGEEYFEHDFKNIKNIHKEDDAKVYGLSDMHDVRRKLSKSGIDPVEVLPQSILEQCKGAEFWRNIDAIDESDEELGKDINTDNDSDNTDFESSTLIGAKNASKQRTKNTRTNTKNDNGRNG